MNGVDYNCYNAEDSIITASWLHNSCLVWQKVVYKCLVAYFIII